MVRDSEVQIQHILLQLDPTKVNGINSHVIGICKLYTFGLQNFEIQLLIKVMVASCDYIIFLQLAAL